MKFVKIACLFIAFLLLARPVQAQEGGERLTFDHLSTEDGLSYPEVYHIIQDDQGFIWLATAEGLNRYDGYEFKVYKHDQSDLTSLSRNHVEVIEQDNQDPNIFWVATHNGLNKFDRRTETFTRYLPNPEDPNSIAGPVLDELIQDKTGGLWLGTRRNGLDYFDPTTEQFTHYRHNPDDPTSLSQNRVTKLYLDNQDTLWVGTSKAGFNRFDPQSNSFIRYEPNPDDPNSVSGPWVQDFVQTDDGMLWISMDYDGLSSFDPETEQFTHYHFDPDTPHALSGVFEEQPWTDAMLKDEAGILWIGIHDDGINRFDPETERFIHYQPDPLDPTAISRESVDELYQDSSGLVWAGLGTGAAKFNPQGSVFTLYQHDPNNPNSLSGQVITEIYEDSAGMLWIGTEANGLNRYDPQTNQFTHYRHDPDNPNSLTNNRVYTIYQDSDGILWIGTEDGFNRFDPTSETFTHYRHDPDNPNSLASNNIYSFLADPDGSFWLGIWETGLNRFDPTTETVTRYPYNDEAGDETSDFVDRRITHITTDSAGNLWLSTYNGFTKFDPTSETFTNYLPDPNNANSIGVASVEMIHVDSQDILWIGTRGGGLSRFDPTSETFSHYLDRDGLPRLGVHHILGDEQGNLWLGTSREVVRFNPETEAFKVYDQRYGLPSDGFRRGARFKGRDGRLYIGSHDGLLSFHPEELQPSQEQPPVYLTKFLLVNRAVKAGEENSPLTEPIEQLDSLTLSYEQSDFGFEFAALSYFAPELIQYRYILERYHDDWVETDSSRRLVNFTNLSPGDYTFRVQATNQDGVWSEHEARLDITITPPWWQTIWFQGGMLLSAVGLVLGGVRWRTKSIEQRNRELESEVIARTIELTESNKQLEIAKEKAEVANEAKSTFLTNMSHELRTPLNAILGFSQIMTRSRSLPREHVDNVGLIQRSGEHLLTLINSVLDLSKIEAGKTTLNESNFDLYHLLSDLQEMFQLTADNQRLQLLFERDDEVPQYIRTDAVKLRQVLINLLNNALKFTEEGGVTLRVSRGESGQDPSPLALQLCFSVEDTGAGIAPQEMDKLFLAFAQTESGRQANEGTGLGLPISRKFVQLMGGEMKVQSTLGQGTTFSFEINVQVVQAAEVDTQKPSRQVIALQPGQQRYRILIVDDKWSNRQLLIKLLNPLGFALREAENGQQAIKVWDEWEPHLIWMDMRMPVMDGYRATQEIKSHTKGQATAIIALTASVLEEEQAVVLDAGCDGFLRKPFRSNDVFDIMHQHIGVRFVYDEPEPESVIVIPQEALTPAALAALPKELLAPLQQAVYLSDIRLTKQKIAQISRLDSALANQLTKLADELEYDEILELIEEANGLK